MKELNAEQLTDLASYEFYTANERLDFVMEFDKKYHDVSGHCAIQIIDFLDSNLIAIGGYSNVTITESIVGFSDDEIKEAMRELIESFFLIYSLDCVYVEHSIWNGFAIKSINDMLKPYGKTVDGNSNLIKLIEKTEEERLNLIERGYQRGRSIK